jgi:hypothetical protein
MDGNGAMIAMGLFAGAQARFAMATLSALAPHAFAGLATCFQNQHTPGPAPQVA